MQKSLELTIKGDEIRLESAMMLDEIYGRRASISRADINDSEVRRLASAGGVGPTLDPNIIGDQLLKVNREIESKRKQRETASGQQARELLEAEAALGRQANNLNQALEKLADNSERTAKIMNDFQEYQNVRNNSQDFLERVFTANSEDRLQIQKELQAYNFARSAIQSGNTEQIKQAAAADPEFYKNLFAGLRQIQGVISPEEYEQRRLEISRGLVGTIPGLENMTAGKLGDKELTWTDILSEKMATEFAKKIQAEEDKRLAAVKELSKVQEEIKTTYTEQNTRLITALQDLTKQLNAVTGTRPQTSNSSSGSSQPRSLPSTNTTTGQNNINETIAKLKADLESIKKSEETLNNIGFFEDLSARITNYSEYTKALDELKKEVAKKYDIQAQLRAAEAEAARTKPTIPNSAPASNVAVSLEQQQQQFLSEYLNDLKALRQKQQATTPNGAPPIPARTATTDTTSPPNTGTASVNLLTLDENTKSFLTQFKSSMDSFGSYVTRMENIANKLPKIPERIEMQGRHTVQVTITGDKIWSTLEPRMVELIQKEVNNKMAKEWNRSGGELGSSGAGGRSTYGAYPV